MALFKSDQNIVDTLKQELAPLGAEMRDGITVIQSSIKSLCERVEALEKENVKLHASVALKKNQLEEEADTKASQKAAEMVSGMGHKAVVDKPEDGEETPSLLEQYTALSGEEQRKFYESHQGEIAKLCEK
ncbi:hypothetical protein CXU19_11860 [Akkermansia muciniphila]|jgi:uncharacterized protein YlxW (UPF0749 family)|nr:hypothetical protein CXU19_11860 [Akkermansia muciniphila]PNC38861.1 hypothetical protein CXU20_10275 [Akkermansia muciniphila]